MRPNFREPRVYDEDFLRRVRQLPCIVPRCNHPAEAAHIGLSGAEHGVKESGHAKPHDFLSLPCCALHHRSSNHAEHVVGAAVFWGRLGIDPFTVARSLYALHQKHQEDLSAIPPMRLVVLEARFNADD